jgi:hypothetical protein
MCHIAAQFVIRLTTICAISVAYGAYSGTFRPFGDERTHDRTQENPRKPTNEPKIPTNEPENLQTNPSARVVAPAHEKSYRGKRLKPLSRVAGNSRQARPAKTNPRHPRMLNEPGRHLTVDGASAIIPKLLPISGAAFRRSCASLGAGRAFVGKRQRVMTISWIGSLWRGTAKPGVPRERHAAGPDRRPTQANCYPASPPGSGASPPAASASNAARASLACSSRWA